MKKNYQFLCLSMASLLLLGGVSLRPYAAEISEETAAEEAIESESLAEAETYEAASDILNCDTGRFIERLYLHALGRECDETGLRNWYNELCSRRQSGAGVGYGFVFSDEVLEKNLSNEEFVDMLYKTFLDRDADAEGKAVWVQNLVDGMTRKQVFKGFVDSLEYTDICGRYGIDKGTFTPTDFCDMNSDVTQFVHRCYRLVLNRDADYEGLNNWCRILLTDANAGDQVANGFIYSDELQGRNLSNEEFVNLLYQTFLDRQADREGCENWINRLENGCTQQEVCDGFIYSQEFKGVCDHYGISCGTPGGSHQQNQDHLHQHR